MLFSKHSCLLLQWLSGCMLRHGVFLNKKNISGNNRLQGRVLGRSSRKSLLPEQQVFIFARGTCSCLLQVSSQTDPQMWLCLLGVGDSEDNCRVQWAASSWSTCSEQQAWDIPTDVWAASAHYQGKIAQKNRTAITTAACINHNKVQRASWWDV